MTNSIPDTTYRKTAIIVGALILIVLYNNEITSIKGLSHLENLVSLEIDFDLFSKNKRKLKQLEKKLLNLKYIRF